MVALSGTLPVGLAGSLDTQPKVPRRARGEASAMGLNTTERVLLLPGLMLRASTNTPKTFIEKTNRLSPILPEAFYDFPLDSVDFIELPTESASR